VTQFLRRRAGGLWLEEVALAGLAARFGTPSYVYSRAALEDAYHQFAGALEGQDALVCYAVKANSNLAVLDVFARLGAGFDIVSGGELARVLAAGAAPDTVVFSGVGKTETEMADALRAGILCFNVESAAELSRLEALAAVLGRRAPVSLRVNPDVDARTHPYIATGLKENKFGVPFATAAVLYRKAAASPHLRVDGIDCHIGSQLTELAPFEAALDRVLELVDSLARSGIPIRHLDAGGGLGVCYRDEAPPPIADYVAAVRRRLGGRQLKLLFEPGRALVANAGLLLTRVELVKFGAGAGDKNFVVVDGAMNDLIRPALYEAWHDIVPVLPASAPSRRFDVVGPVCESGDFLGRDRELDVAAGSLLAVLSAGAYGMVMSSNYNTRPRAAEIMVDGTAAHLVRRRETIAELFQAEQRLP
jgi:diaminopimelate decarboxylase